MSHNPVILVHGGAWAIPDDLVEAHLNGVRKAAAAGWQVLQRGGSALDAIEAAVLVMEDDEAFDAGRGSFLNRDGRVQLDALMMDGRTLRAGGVGCVEHIRNPIQLARKVLDESPHVYLVAEGAEAFATLHGMTLCPNEDLIIPREVKRLRAAQQVDGRWPLVDGRPLSTIDRPPSSIDQHLSRAKSREPSTKSHDTVGALALDQAGNIAAATSTGGTLNKTPGRVGDSSLIGCGCYADNESAACSTTGWGEPMMKLVLAKWAADRVLGGSDPAQVAPEAMALLRRRLDGHGGIILLDAKGRFGLAHNTPRMAWACQTTTLQEHGIRRN